MLAARAIADGARGAGGALIGIQDEGVRCARNQMLSAAREVASAGSGAKRGPLARHGEVGESVESASLSVELRQ